MRSKLMHMKVYQNSNIRHITDSPKILHNNSNFVEKGISQILPKYCTIIQILLCCYNQELIGVCQFPFQNKIQLYHTHYDKVNKE
jgi:hypothetical protein